MMRLLTKREAAQAFHVTTKTLDRWRKNPDVPLSGFRIGNRVLFSEAELEAVIRQHGGTV